MDLAKLLSHEDRTAIERWVESRTATCYLGQSRSLARVLGKYLMFLPTNDLSVVPHLLLNGYWEMWITMAVARQVRPGWQCIDVGANVGYFTMLLADLVGEDGEVHAWEVQPDLADCIRRSAHMNGFQDRVNVFNVAASDDAGQVVLKLLSADWDRGSVGTAPAPPRGPGSPVMEPGPQQMRARLDDDDFCDLERVDFVKIDTEGHEPQVWAGMRAILDRALPMHVLLEFTPRLYEDPAAFLAQIQADGFSLRRVDFDGELQTTGPDELLDGRDMEMVWASRG